MPLGSKMRKSIIAKLYTIKLKDAAIEVPRAGTSSVINGARYNLVHSARINMKAAPKTGPMTQPIPPMISMPRNHMDSSKVKLSAVMCVIK